MKHQSQGSRMKHQSQGSRMKHQSQGSRMKHQSQGLLLFFLVNVCILPKYVLSNTHEGKTFSVSLEKCIKQVQLDKAREIHSSLSNTATQNSDRHILEYILVSLWRHDKHMRASLQQKLTKKRVPKTETTDRISALMKMSNIHHDLWKCLKNLKQPSDMATTTSNDLTDVALSKLKLHSKRHFFRHILQNIQDKTSSLKSTLADYIVDHKFGIVPIPVSLSESSPKHDDDLLNTMPKSETFNKIQNNFANIHSNNFNVGTSSREILAHLKNDVFQNNEIFRRYDVSQENKAVPRYYHSQENKAVPRYYHSQENKAVPRYYHSQENKTFNRNDALQENETFKRNDAHQENKTMKSIKNPWLSAVYTKRHPQSLSINNALMSLTDMMMERDRQNLNKNRNNLRYHLMVQG